jgi:taurine transport system substrate-binding protein
MAMKSILVAAMALASVTWTDRVVAQSGEVTIAHQDMIIPFRAAQAAGTVETATGYRINWKPFSGGGDVIKAMASGDVSIGEVGSSAATVAAAQGLDIEVVWILDVINDAEQLVVTSRSGVTDIAGLKGKTIATPLASTAHYSLLYALRKAGLKASDVRILNMRPPEIAAAWARGDIDGAYVWNPVLARLKAENGRVILSSADVARLGAPTFDALIVDRNWANKNKAFVTSLVTAMANADIAFRSNRDNFVSDPERVGRIARLVGASPQDVPEALGGYAFPIAQEQASDAWLGGGSAGGVARALSATAVFLREQGRIVDVPDDFSKFVDPEFAASAAIRP